MANSYYRRVYDYTPRTKAKGEEVKDDFTSVEVGFEKLPPHNNNATGFTDVFEVADPTGDQSPVPMHFMESWVADYVKRYVDEQLQPDVPDGGLLWSAPLATAGQIIINPPYKFTMANLYINGVMQDRMRGSYSIVNNQIVLSQALEENDEVHVIIGYPRPDSPQGEWVLVTEDYEASTGEQILLDSTKSYFNITLPANPLPGSQIHFLEIGGAADANTITVWGNGDPVMGADSMVIKINGVSVSTLYVEGYGWRVIE